MTQRDKRTPHIRKRLGQYGRFVQSIRVECFDEFVSFTNSKYAADRLAATVATWLLLCPGLSEFIFRVLSGENCEFGPLFTVLAPIAHRLKRLQLAAAFWDLSTFRAFNSVLQDAHLLETLTLDFDVSYQVEPHASYILPLPLSLERLRDLTDPRATCLRAWTADTAPECRSLKFEYLDMDDWKFLQTCRGASLTSLKVWDLSRRCNPAVPFDFPKLRHVRVLASLGLCDLSDLFAPTTPIESLYLPRLDDAVMAAIQLFLARQPRKTLKRLKFRYARRESGNLDDYLAARMDGDRDESLERRLAAFIALDQRRLQEYSAWADTHGIEFSAPAWIDVALARQYSAA